MKNYIKTAMIYGIIGWCGCSSAIADVLWSNWTYQNGYNSRLFMYDGTKTSLVFDNQNQAFGIDYDAIAQRVYWSGGTVESCLIDGTGHQVHVPGSHSSVPRSMAWDESTSSVVFTDLITDQIYRYNHAGDIISLYTTGYQPDAIALDSVTGNLFWTEYATPRKIAGGSISGSGEKTSIIDAGLIYPRGIDVDSVNKKIYWTDYETKKMSRSNYDGSEPEILLDGINGMTRIAIDETGRDLYYTVYNDIYVYDLETQESRLYLQTGEFIGDIAIVSIPEPQTVSFIFLSLALFVVRRNICSSSRHGTGRFYIQLNKLFSQHYLRSKAHAPLPDKWSI